MKVQNDLFLPTRRVIFIPFYVVCLENGGWALKVRRFQMYEVAANLKLASNSLTQCSR